VSTKQADAERADIIGKVQRDIDDANARLAALGFADYFSLAIDGKEVGPRDIIERKQPA
jgi:hypothetical protein